MELGEALYREISGRSPRTEVGTVGGAVEYFLTKAGGVAAQAARLAGVPASTFRGWIRGRQPKNAADLVGTATLAQRRDRLPRGRERRLRAEGSMDGMTIDGTLTVSAQSGDRHIEIGVYLMDDLGADLVDAYLDGADLEHLAEIFVDGITTAPFYSRTLGDGAWDIHSMDGWA